MDSYQPLVSIVTPVYNGSKYVEELIVSVVNQDYRSIEHIIIDDGSTDNGETVLILKRYPHLRWWTRPNRGAYATMNEGLAASTGELVTMICADDKYASRTSISDAVKLWSSDRNCDAIYGDTIYIDESGHILPNEPPRSAPIWLYRYYPNTSQHCSLLVKRKIIIEKKLFLDLTFPLKADYDWIIRLIRAGCRFKRLKKPIAMFRQHPLQRSHDLNPAHCDEIRRLAQVHGKLNPIIDFFVNKWWRFVKLKNLFLHRGLVICLHAIYLFCRHGKKKPAAQL